MEVQKWKLERLDEKFKTEIQARELKVQEEMKKEMNWKLAELEDKYQKASNKL